jgi:hypothetical protein
MKIAMDFDAAIRKHHEKMINDPIGFIQEYLLPMKKGRGRPKMTEVFFYDPFLAGWGSIVSTGLSWDGKVLIINGTIIK